MRIIVTTHHACGRCIKISRALKNLGYELHLVTNRVPADKGIFDSVTYYADEQGFKTALGLFNDNDLFHHHNEPSWQTTIIRETFPSARIVLDMHDSNYWRIEGMKWFEEDVAMQCADALVFTSKSMQDSIEKYNKPHIIIPSAVLKEDFVYHPQHYWGGLVSQGGHSLPNNDNPLESWRDYTALYALLRDKKQVFAYCPAFKVGSDLDNHYINLGAKLGVFSHKELIDKMGRHDWSLCGNLRKDKIWDLALPNKFFDAMGSGIPVVNFGCKEVEPLVQNFDVGINVETVDELIERWDECTQKRYKVFINRDFFTMENHIDKLVRLYREL